MRVNRPPASRCFFDFDFSIHAHAMEGRRDGFAIRNREASHLF